MQGFLADMVASTRASIETLKDRMRRTTMRERVLLGGLVLGAAVYGGQPILSVLFEEAFAQRCGRQALLDRLFAELGITTAVQLGIMVETPAAAVTADLLAREADFLSVGTNDLTQYTLAMDRANPAVASALDGLHPAVLRLIGETCRGGAAHGRWTGVCGGLASDPLAVPILLGLGVTELSTAPVMVPTIKALVSDVTLAACRDHAAAALACTSAAEVRALARSFATKEMSA